MLASISKRKPLSNDREHTMGFNGSSWSTINLNENNTLTTDWHHQGVYRGLGDVVPFIQQSHFKLEAILGTWNRQILLSRTFQKVFNRWHIWWIQQPPVQGNSGISCQWMLVDIMLFEGQMMEFEEGHDNLSQDSISITLPVQVVINEMHCAIHNKCLPTPCSLMIF